MSYRSHYKAIYVQNIALRAENARLRAEVSENQSAYHQARQRQDDTERRRARASCLSCGGVILPVAVFAGHRSGDPLPLRLSTARFLDRAGGYTHASLVRARACASCGLIHHFLGLDAERGPAADEDDP